MANIEQIRVPDIGDFDQVEVIEILVAVGDQITAEQSLITLESDKASMEIPAPKAGVVKTILIELGEKVSEGSPIIELETGAAAESSAPAPKPSAPAEPAAQPAAPVQSPPQQSAPPAAPAAAAGKQEICVPDIGDFSDVEVIEVLVAPGDEVSAEQSLITLESDKASMEVPSPAAGRVVEMLLKLGDRVAEGSPILILETSTAGSVAEPAAVPAGVSQPAPSAGGAAAETVEPPRREPPVAVVDEVGFRKAHASPSVRRFARELGADIHRIEGSGPKGRILKSDVKTWVKKQLERGPAPAAAAAPAGAGIPPIPEIDFSQFGEIETVALPRIKRLSGPHLHRAWLNLPMVTHHDEADITEMEAFRKSLADEAAKKGVRVTALVFIMKALVDGMRAYPNFNASLSADGASLIHKKYFNIGIAADTPNGLVVPVIRDVDKKSLYELSSELAELSAKAREGKLSPAQMSGGCISISSLGGIGGTAFTPIVNAPEVAILGVTRSRMQPVWNGKEFVPRLMLPLDLTYDHRAIDGADAARFVARLCQSLGDIRRLLL